MNASQIITKDKVEPAPAVSELLRGIVLTSSRTAQIREIRAEIKAGTFVTPERIEGTVEKLLKILS